MNRNSRSVTKVVPHFRWKCVLSGSAPSRTRVDAAPSTQGAPARACPELQGNGSEAPLLSRCESWAGGSYMHQLSNRESNRRKPSPDSAPSFTADLLGLLVFQSSPTLFSIDFSEGVEGQGETHGLAACHQRPYWPGSEPQPTYVPCTTRPARPGLMLQPQSPGQGTLSL